ncbi:MAG: FAD binding domain-containing protein [Syntrophales bacterium]
MKRLKPFEYREPKTLREAIKILAGEGPRAAVLAGGTDILVRMKQGVVAPSLLVNLKRIKGLDRIQRPKAGGLSIGTLTPIAAIERSSPIQRHYPVLAAAAGFLGSPSIRQLATLGGNVGRSSPAADMVPSLVVLKGRVRAEGPAGSREISLDTFFKGPGQNALAPGELITALALPDPAPASGAAYVRLGRREGMDCALVGVAASLMLGGDGRVGEALLAMASCGPVPLRARNAEAFLCGEPLDEKRLREAARLTAGETSPISDMRACADYRKEMVAVLAFRALTAAWQAARKSH